ncbi:MAG: hypothetical protein U5K31_13765 [Balneolaceae bacterium]|nr:hypothetical protein [Balneolaceae bacterium]
MAESDTLSRRKFLLILLGTAGLSFAGGYYLRSSSLRETLERLEEGLDEEELLKNFSGIRQEMQHIGERVMNDPLKGYTRQQLVAELDASLASQQLSKRVMLDLDDKLKSRLRSDFEENRTFLVDNWILTQTEAKICALFYLAS